MRGIMPLLFAGLLAVVATPVSALCADDGAGGCSALRHDLLIEVRTDCPDGAALCLWHEADFGDIPNDAVLNVTVVNKAGIPIDFELFTHIRSYQGDASPDAPRSDDAAGDGKGDGADDGSAPRLAADRILLLEDIAAGESRTQEVRVEGDVTHLTVQALGEGGVQADRDVELLAIRALAFGDDGQTDEELADDSGMADASSDKDAPYLGLVGVVVALGVLTFAARGRKE